MSRTGTRKERLGGRGGSTETRSVGALSTLYLASRVLGAHRSVMGNVSVGMLGCQGEDCGMIMVRASQNIMNVAASVLATSNGSLVQLKTWHWKGCATYSLNTDPSLPNLLAFPSLWPQVWIHSPYGSSRAFFEAAWLGGYDFAGLPSHQEFG